MNLGLQWRWLIGVIALIVALLAAVNLCLHSSLPPYLTELARNDLTRITRVAAQTFTPLLTAPAPDPIAIDELARRLAHHSQLRFTIIAPDGRVIGESDQPRTELAHITNHLDRPEVQAALRTGTGDAIRHSATVDAELLYVAIAVPVATGGPYFVRAALPLTEIARTAAHIRRAVTLASLMVMLLALPVVFVLARRITLPLIEMRDMARRVTAGDLTARTTTHLDGELATLATGLNTMAAQLELRLHELAGEKAELHATLANMTEGVLVVDTAGIIRLANRALQRQLDVTANITGRSVLEAFRNAALQEVVTQALNEDQVTSRELTLLGTEERVFETNASRLHGPGGEPTGAVIVLHDITRINTLENMRKDFVANVSHELRTPLSIIKGYVETLLEEPRPDPATADTFLQTIQRHSARLEALIGDLLTISSLESQQRRLTVTTGSLRAIAEAACDELAPQATAKQTQLDIEFPADFPTVSCDPGRLHQVFVNFLDNAIKYTAPGSRITVTGADIGQELQVCVADNGPGISPEHLDRVFERFYRVDKSRSRDVGGTGLGLSIVKHIIHAHHGRVWAESELRKGSRFYFTLPKS